MIACVALPRTIPPRSAAPCRLLVTSPLHTDSRVMNSVYDFSTCGLCPHIIGPPPSPIFSSLPWQFTFVHPLFGHTWTKHSSRTVCRLVAHEVLLTSLELVHHCLDLGPLSPTSTISAMHHLVLTTRMATLWHILQEYPPLRPLDLSLLDICPAGATFLFTYFLLEVSETTIPFGLLRLAEQLMSYSALANALARMRPFANTVPTAPFRV
ncbi:hypothetical protein BHM03_00017788 [Ensete ventricosum]|nr:hypothetical protein BHM03_00017788 [Ensete ventricosum]